MSSGSTSNLSSTSRVTFRPIEWHGHSYGRYSREETAETPDRIHRKRLYSWGDSTGDRRAAHSDRRAAVATELQEQGRSASRDQPAFREMDDSQGLANARQEPRRSRGTGGIRRGWGDRSRGSEADRQGELRQKPACH